MMCGLLTLCERSTVVRRPHFQVEAGEARFLISRRMYRQLGPDELAVWKAVAEPRTLQLLRHELGERADQTVQSLWDAQMIETVEAELDHDRRRVLVIEPHADDAALSVGGLLWDRRHECHFTIATIASRSNFTSYYYSSQAYFNTEVVTDLRRKESELFARLVGGVHIDVGLNDAPLRYRDVNWSREDFARHRAAIAAATSRLATPEEAELWRLKVHELLASTDSEELWMPLGGPHADHRIASAVLLDILSRHPELRQGRRVFLYLEVPYAARFPAYSEDALRHLNDAGFRFHAVTHSIDHSYTAKLRLVSVYGSQFKLEALRKDIDDSAQDTDALVERAWEVVKFPAAVNFASLITRFDAARTDVEAIRNWQRRNVNAEHVRVVLQVPAGRWAQDLPILLRMFPRATLRVVASPEATAEIELHCDVRVRHQSVRKGKGWWAAAAISIAVGPGMPTLFLVSERQKRIAERMTMLWPRCDTVVIQSMDRLHEASSNETCE